MGRAGAVQVRQALKARLLAGEFGRLKQSAMLGSWPRSSAYYGRAEWAGRLMLGGERVLDSPIGNAMAVRWSSLVTFPHSGHGASAAFL